LREEPAFRLWAFLFYAFMLIYIIFNEN
jgi:hypothetical protein